MYTNKKFIFGIGTGRTGTNSLAKLLSLQENTSVTHESVPLLPWNQNKSFLDFKLQQIGSRDHHIVGDVCMSYIQYIEEMIELLENVKFICFQRNPDEIVKSYIIKTKGRNHWTYHDGTEWNLDYKWDPCFPKYPLENKKEALYTYIQDYSMKVEMLCNKYPDRIYVTDMKKALNDSGEQNEMLEFIDYWENPKIILDIRENTTEKNLQGRKKKISYTSHFKTVASKFFKLR